MSDDDVKNCFTQRDLIDTQLSQKSQGGSSDGLFVRGRTFEKGSTSGNGNKGKGRSKSRGPNKNKTCNYYKLKGHIEKDCWKWKKKNANDDGARDATRDGHLRVWVGSGPYPNLDPNFRVGSRPGP